MEEQYLNITQSIKYHPSLNSDEKLILAEIMALSKLPNGCIASDKHFARIINKTRQTANGIVKKFEKIGYITITVILGKGKITKLADNFWQLIRTPVKIEDTSEVLQESGDVELLDISCRDTLQVGVENEDTTCRETDTINTSTITDILLQEVLHYTGATGYSSIENIENQYQDACSRLIELMNTDPAQLTNPFIIEFQDCFAGLELFFGAGFIENCHIFKSNNELYEIYGSSNFYEVRKDLIYVRDNMDRFLRQKTFI
jgi:hypothetical protein